MPINPKEKYVYIGIDPGLSGGLACIEGAEAKVFPVPRTERDVWEWFDNARTTASIVFAVIEKVHAMPGNGVSSMFKFGTGYGGLRMALTAAEIPWEEATPQAWQKGLGISKRDKAESGTEWKNRLKAKAQQLFPSVRVTLATADALLIAEYCKRKREGSL